MAFFGVFFFRVLLLKAAGWMLTGFLAMGSATFDYAAFTGDAVIPLSLIVPFASVAPP